jgi:hypothetical protein
MRRLHIAPHVSVLEVDQPVGSRRQAVAANAVFHGRRGKKRSSEEFKPRLLLRIHQSIEPLVGIGRVANRQHEASQRFHRPIGDRLRLSEQIDERRVEIFETCDVFSRRVGRAESIAAPMKRRGAR